MAPPGVNSFYEHLDTLSSFGPCYSSFSLSLKSSLQLSMSPPGIKRTLSPSSTSRVESDILSILSDHDYVTKPVSCMGGRDMHDGVKDACSDDETEAADECNTTTGDAMLSSAADFSNETMTDTDFLQELDSIDFTDLDPCSDVAMEDSFQDFIDSVLDKSTPPFFGSDLDSDSIQQGDHEAVIFNKEDFLGFLGLQPVQHTSISSGGCVDNCIPKSGSVYGFHSDIPLPETVPTKKCSSCSPTEACSRIVYSTASSYSCATVPATAHIGSINVKQSCFPQSVLSVMSREQMSPLTIDTSFDFAPELSGPLCHNTVTSDVAMEDAAKPQGNEDDATRDLLKWLHEEQGSVRVGSMVEHQTQLQVVAPSLDMESFVDLDEYVTESSCPQTYANQNKDPSSVYDCGAHLKLSFLSTDRHGFQYCGYLSNDNVPSDISMKSSQGYNSSPDSQLSTGTWPCSRTASASSSPSINTTELFSTENNENTQLALLNLFSEENASALHSIEDSDLRFI